MASGQSAQTWAAPGSPLHSSGRAVNLQQAFEEGVP